MVSPGQEPTAERNLDGYGAPPIPWAKVRAQLDQGFPQEPGRGVRIGIPAGWQP